MAHLIYTTNASLDGYIEDNEGRFDWTTPDEEYFKFISNLVKEAGTYLYGRRIYETMMVWETDPRLAAESPLWRDFAETWQAANKIVFSKTLESVSTGKTQLERSFNAEAIQQLKKSVGKDILIGGAELAAQAFRSGLIDEYHLFLIPIILGGGKPSLPNNVRLDLNLLEERRFGSGVVFLRYQIRQGKTN